MRLHRLRPILAALALASAAPATAAPAPAATRVEAGPPGLASLAPLVDRVKAAVVNVEVHQKAPTLSGPEAELFERFFGRRPDGGPPPVQRGTGSGVLIDPSGRVLTNNHVVEGAASIRVRLDDGRRFDARVVGRDPLTDLALLEVDAGRDPLPFARLGDSDALRVGDWVVAIGNPFGLASSVSAGIVSAKAREIGAGPYDDFLQTDAAINPGNSGGPLFDLSGRVVGVNTAIVGGGSGVGFAVPSNMAREILPQLERGEVRRGWLGVAIQDLTPELAAALGAGAGEGAVISSANEGGPGHRAGLRAEDVVVAVDGAPVESARALIRTIGFRAPGSEVTLRVLRGGKPRDVRVKLGERPDLEGNGVGVGPRDEPEAKSPAFGLTFEDGERGGAYVTAVEPGSPADRAGLVPGMLVTEANRKRVRDAGAFARVLRGAKKGETLLLRVEAEGASVLRALPVP